MTDSDGKQIHLLDKGRVMAAYGPMEMVISASIGEVPQAGECVRAARESFHCLESVAQWKNSISVPWPQVNEPVQDEVVANMVSASRFVGDRDLTPMSAVAGAIADAVADFLYERGMTKVIVNNGGDIAIRVARDQSVQIAVGTQGVPGYSPFTIVLDGSEPSWGVATSGLGGRSLTKGIAQLVTVVSTRAAYADAAATAVANATFVQDPGVIFVQAEDVEPNTDIPGARVVREVGDITEESIMLGLHGGKKKADNLIARGVILGALIIVKEMVALAGSFEGLVSPRKIH